MTSTTDPDYAWNTYRIGVPPLYTVAPNPKYTASDGQFVGQLDKAMKAAKEQMARDLERTIFSEREIIKGLAPLIKEKDMSDVDIARRAVNKKKEERAEALAELLLGFLEEEEWSNGDTFSWSVRFHENPDKEYHYVVVKGGNYWYITGDGTRYTKDEIAAKVVELHLRGNVASEHWDAP
jgi:hypothetical protein